MDEYARTEGDEVIVTWGGDDGDGIGRLTVRAAANGFAGIGEAWTDRTQMLEFSLRLSAYPLREEVSISAGFGGDEAEEHVGIAVGPVGSHGQVGIRVHLATPVWPNTRPESRREVRLELLTTYQRLETFSTGLRRVVEGTLHEAIIGGELLL